MMTKNRKKSFRTLLIRCAMAAVALGVSVNGMNPVTSRAEESLQPKMAQEADASDRCLNIGSVSKVYVVTAVMQLVDQGRVNLDAPVTDYIPEFKMADERYKKITVRMLMNHTSGLMGTVYGGIFLFGDAGSEYHDTFLEILQKEQLKYEPGAFNCYCNDGFTLLEIIVERVSKMTYTDYLEENICKPLSLDKTGSMWNVDADSIVPNYVNGNIKMLPERGAGIGAGGILSTAREVCNFGAAFFIGNRVLLSEKAKKEMAKNNRAGDCLEDFGLGWDEVRKEDYERAGVTVLSKGGDTFYQNASLVIAPDEAISIAVLASGGGSSIDEKVALALMDVALAEQGIHVDHPEEEKPELTDALPESFLSYEGLYASAQGTVKITFPNRQYMQITSLTYDRDFEKQYMYSEDGVFVEMSGDIASGKAIPVHPVNTVAFEEKNGQIYLVDPSFGCMLYRVPANKVSEKVQKAWEQRNGVSYYYVNGSVGDVTYSTENNCFTLHADEAAWGYVNGCLMQDENHAGYETIMPGTVSRDLGNIRMEQVDGKEYLCIDEFNYRLISEECIPVLTEDVSGVELQSKEACWYKIDGAENLTLHLELPENAAVYVYDKYGNIRYSSYMMDYGNEIPLPEYGMIVFIGETGGQVKIRMGK